MRLFTASYTAEWLERTGAGASSGISWLHVAVPPLPLALVNFQTSFRRGCPACSPIVKTLWSLVQPRRQKRPNLKLTPALLRLDPMFDPLRNDPRFQKLAASPSPKEAK